MILYCKEIPLKTLRSLSIFKITKTPKNLKKDYLEYPTNSCSYPLFLTLSCYQVPGDRTYYCLDRDLFKRGKELNTRKRREGLPYLFKVCNLSEIERFYLFQFYHKSVTKKQKVSILEEEGSIYIEGSWNYELSCYLYWLEDSKIIQYRKGLQEKIEELRKNAKKEKEIEKIILSKPSIICEEVTVEDKTQLLYLYSSEEFPYKGAFLEDHSLLPQGKGYYLVKRIDKQSEKNYLVLRYSEETKSLKKVQEILFFFGKEELFKTLPFNSFENTVEFFLYSSFKA